MCVRKSLSRERERNEIRDRQAHTSETYAHAQTHIRGLKDINPDKAYQNRRPPEPLPTSVSSVRCVFAVAS